MKKLRAVEATSSKSNLSRFLLISQSIFAVIKLLYRVHPIFFGLRRCGKLKACRRSSRLQMPPRKLALAWLRQLVAIRAAVA